MFIVRANEWQAQRFVAELPTILTELPPEILELHPGEMPQHSCESRELKDVLADLEAASRSLGAYTASLTEDELHRPGLFGGRAGFDTNTLGVIRHALHDAEHHLLDIRRGIAKPIVAANPLPTS